ncbi:MAG: hypothetical protein LBR70_00145 [Lactobacillaceae bacterium]|jgi:hypothetical protein|nr:hypothetical protein [Lactobacillaceae bacterium]
MKKNVIRTFVYSFAISTLVIFSINKLQAYFPHKKPQTSEVKVSNKNITSFLKAGLEKESENLENDIPSINEESISYSYNTAAEEEVSDNFQTGDTSEFELTYIEEETTDTANADENIIDAFASENIAQIVEEPQPSSSSWVISGIEQDNIESEEEIASNLSGGEQAKKTLIPIQKSNAPVTNEKVIITNNADANEVAMFDNASIRGMITENESTGEDSGSAEDSPWVVAKAKISKNKLVLEEPYAKESSTVEAALDVTPKSSGGEVKVAEMVRNILIPIPEDILKEENLTPQLISSKRNKELQDKIEQNIRMKRAEEEAARIKEKSIAEEENKNADDDDDKNEEKKSRKTIFDSISSIFSGGKTPEVGVSKGGEANKFNTASTVYTVKKDSKNKKENKVTKILPTEIKLSFQPNRAEISGQTLKWIEAFANKTNEDETVALEIRIDGTSSFELQQKRLTLLHNILTNKGVRYNKINTVFTTREPNSFIIRTVRISDKSVAMDSNPKIDENSKYFKNW